MNKIVKALDANGQPSYNVITEDGKTAACTRWYEKKTDAWHIKLPKDNASGRTYIRESLLTDKTEYEFETKTEHRTGLVGGGWKSKMTPDEAKRMTELEAEIEAIKKTASARQPEKVDPNSVEAIEAAIEKYKAKLAAARAKQPVAEPVKAKGKKA